VFNITYGEAFPGNGELRPFCYKHNFNWP